MSRIYSLFQFQFRFSSDVVVKLIKELNLLSKIQTVSFDADVYEAKFDFNFDIIIELINKYPNFYSFTLNCGEEIEIILNQRNFFAITWEENDRLFENLLLTLNPVLYSHSADSVDHHLQKYDKPITWKIENVKIPNYVELYPDPLDWKNEGKMLINTESLPGHEHVMRGDGDGLWFGSCWQMHFSEIYYKYIPKELFDAFTECEENVVMDNGLRKITLYKNPNDYALPKNRERQWLFRRQLGIDSIAHEVCNPPKKEPKELPVEITKQNLIKGSTKVTRYLDKRKNLCLPSKACFKEVKEYDEIGLNIVFEQIEKI